MMTKAECIAYVESHLEVCYAVNNRAYTCGRTINVKGGGNHSFGCAQPNISVAFSIMNKPSAGWAVNAILGDFHTGEGRIQLCMPYKARPWGFGSGKNGSWNNSYVQWEVLEPSGHTYAGGTMIGYDVAKNQIYFERMWKMLVCWNVYIADKFGFGPDTIHDHAESYKAGMGSNHADMGQWLPKHGKSMDALRAEVAAILSAPTVTVPVSYNGQVTASSLLCRTAPSDAESSIIVRTYPKGTVVAISQECEEWGYTGEGWVSLNYIKKTTKTMKEDDDMTDQEFEARLDAAMAKREEKQHYATLGDVPTSYKPAVEALMQAGVLKGYDGGKDGLVATIGDNTIKVDETFCRIVTMLSRPGALAALQELAVPAAAEEGSGV